MTLTPKEKAKELVDKMYKVHSGSASEITLHFAIQCALIAVDEILNILKAELGDPIEYWQEVKQEINKL
jgi:hypothetical protein